MGDRETLKDLRRLEELERRAQEMDFASQGAVAAQQARTTAKDVGQSFLGGLKETALMPFSLTAQAPSPGGLSPFDEQWNQELMAQAERGRGQVAEVMQGHTPATSPGRYTKAVAANLPLMGLNPGGPVTKMSSALLSGLGAQSFDDLISGGDPSQSNALARVAGSLIGGVGPAYIAGRTPNADLLLHNTMKGMTPNQWDDAGNAAATLDDYRIPHYKTQVIGKASAADDVMEEATAQAVHRNTALQHIQDAPVRAAKAVDEWINRHLFPQMDSHREFKGNLKNLAHRKLQQVEAQSNRAYAGKMPPSVARANYPAARVDRMHKELAGLQKQLGPAGGGSDLERFIDTFLQQDIGGAKVPITNRWHLNEAYKRLNQKITTDPNFGNLPYVKMKEILGRYTGDFTGAREAKQRVMSQKLNPMQKGLLGDLSRAGGKEVKDKYTTRQDLLNVVFAKGRQPAEIEELAWQLGDQNWPQVVAEHLRKQADNILTTDAGPDAIAKLSTTLLKTGPIRDNLEAAIRVNAKMAGESSDEVWDSFSALMKAFDTFADAKIAPGINRADIGQLAGFSPTGTGIAPYSRLGRVMWDRAARQTYEKIVELATTPDGLAQLRRLADADPTSQWAKSLIHYFATSAVQADLTPKTSPMLPGQETR